MPSQRYRLEGIARNLPRMPSSDGFPYFASNGRELDRIGHGHPKIYRSLYTEVATLEYPVGKARLPCMVLHRAIQSMFTF